MSAMNASNRRPMRPAGLYEALWACFLDDYLSEEEDGEFSKIVGKTEESMLCFPRSETQPIKEDPRTIKARGGIDDGLFAGAMDGTPGVWSNDPAPDLPPVLWLALPPETSRDERNALGRSTRQTDNREDEFHRQQISKQQKHPPRHPWERSRSMKQAQNLDSGSMSRGRSREGSRAHSNTGSRGRSRAGSRAGSRATKSSKTSGRQQRRSKSRTREQPEQREPIINARAGSQAREAERKTTRSISSRQRKPGLLEENLELPKQYIDAQDRSLKSSSRKSATRDTQKRRRAKV